MFNLDNDMTMQKVKSYITTGKTVSTVLDIEQLSQPDWRAQSFRVVTWLSEKETVRAESFWPHLVGTRPYIRRRMVGAKSNKSNGEP